jgi:hypothetical protein
LKPAAGATGADIVSAQLLEEILFAVDKPESGFHVRLGRESFAALTAALERRTG